MEIVKYRDIRSKDCLLPLMDNAFGWTLTSRKFEELVGLDPRLIDTPIGFCAVENGSIVGFVGVMHLLTRTICGETSHAGGIYRVATLPSYLRKGVCTTLLNHAHEYFREMGYSFSFLTTNRTLVAYSLYMKLGYTELLESRSAYKVIRRKGNLGVSKKATEHGRELDLENILRIYNEYMKGKYGFVIRDKPFLMMLRKAEGVGSLKCVIENHAYAIYKEEKQMNEAEGILIRELVGLKSEKISRLIDLIEREAKDVVFDRTILDDALLRVYASRGYMIQPRSNIVLMTKTLAPRVSFEQVYGGKFCLAGLDFPQK